MVITQRFQFWSCIFPCYPCYCRGCTIIFVLQHSVYRKSQQFYLIKGPWVWHLPSSSDPRLGEWTTGGRCFVTYLCPPRRIIIHKHQKHLFYSPLTSQDLVSPPCGAQPSECSSFCWLTSGHCQRRVTQQFWTQQVGGFPTWINSNLYEGCEKSKSLVLRIRMEFPSTNDKVYL